MNQFNIVDALMPFSAWVSWRYELVNGSYTKVPYDPRTGRPASSNDPNTWTTQDVVYNGTAHHYTGPGFMLSDADEFTVVDLDNPFVRKLNGKVYEITQESDPVAYAEACEIRASYDSIINDFDSYTEWSPSGCGFHIWIKGKLQPDWGKRRGTFEIYSRLRFMTITGRSYHAEPKPIAERQGRLELFAMKLGLEPGNLVHVESAPETINDIELYTRIANSGCGNDFVKLFHGDASGYPSGSEADLALANYIGSFTDNLEQCERLFRSSPWFAGRTKLHGRSDLVTRVVRLSFDRKPPPIDISAVLAKVDAARRAFSEPEANASEPVAQQEHASASPASPQVPAIHASSVMSEMPPGVLGDIANYLYNVAPRPIPETALAGAIIFLAGVTGRAFNISGTGLNQYVVMLGASGVGKESISSGLSRLIHEIKPTLPAVTMFQGPSMIQSAPALYKMFGPQEQQGATPSFFSIIGEFGKKLKVMTDPRASANDQMLHAAYLDLYQKSGRGNIGGGIRYSESAKSVVSVHAPAFSFIGDTVPGRFFEACTPEAIEGGLVPRMLLIQYDGDRPVRNRHGQTYQLDEQAALRIKAVVEASLIRNQMHDPIDVRMTSEAERLLDELDAECDAKWNKGRGDEVQQAIWNRVHLKALKLAALRAVGNNPHDPMVDARDAEWAIRFVKSDAHILLSRFQSGEVSSGNVHDDKHRAIKTALRYYFRKGITALAKTQAHYANVEAFKVGLFPGAVIRQYVMKLAPFKKRQGFDEGRAYEQTLKELEQDGVIQLKRNETGSDGFMTGLGIQASKSVWIYVTEPASLEAG